MTPEDQWKPEAKNNPFTHAICLATVGTTVDSDFTIGSFFVDQNLLNAEVDKFHFCFLLYYICILHLLNAIIRGIFFTLFREHFMFKLMLGVTKVDMLSKKAQF